MITKERLEELIEQGATIWKVPYGTPIETKLNKNSYVCNQLNLREDYLMEYSTEKWSYTMSGLLSHLFETKEDAEEYAEFGNITRTERLELPSWENIESIIEQKKRFGLNHSDRVLAKIITKDSIYYFKLCKDLDLFTFELKQTYIGEDLYEQLSSKFPISLGKVTKNNYDKARRLCVKLFKGEKV